MDIRYDSHIGLIAVSLVTELECETSKCAALFSYNNLHSEMFTYPSRTELPCKE